MHDVVPFAILHSWSLSMTTRPPMEAIFFEIKMNLFVVLCLHSKESCFHNKYGIQICSRLGVSSSQGRGRELAPASLDQSPGPRTKTCCWVNSPKLTWVYFYKKGNFNLIHFPSWRTICQILYRKYFPFARWIVGYFVHLKSVVVQGSSRKKTMQ